MENCLDCSCLEQPASGHFKKVWEARITKFLVSFVIEGAEDQSKIK